MVFAGASQLRNVNNVIVLRQVHGIDLLEMDTGAKMKCGSDYYIELSLCMRCWVTSFHLRSALGESPESSKQISWWQLQI